jgi:hypothetical protein
MQLTNEHQTTLRLRIATKEYKFSTTKEMPLLGLDDILTLSAALAMFVCGWADDFLPTWNFPSSALVHKKYHGNHQSGLRRLRSGRTVD